MDAAGGVKVGLRGAHHVGGLLNDLWFELGSVFDRRMALENGLDLLDAGDGRRGAGDSERASGVMRRPSGSQ